MAYPRTTLGPRFSRNALQPLLRFFLALRDRGGQRLGGEAGGRVAAGDARQHMRDGEIGERRIAGNPLREFERLGHAGADVDEILREPDGAGLLRRRAYARSASCPSCAQRRSAAAVAPSRRRRRRCRGFLPAAHSKPSVPPRGYGRRRRARARRRRPRRGARRRPAPCRTGCDRRRDARSSNARSRRIRRALRVRSGRGRR